MGASRSREGVTIMSMVVIKSSLAALLRSWPCVVTVSVDLVLEEVLFPLEFFFLWERLFLGLFVWLG